MENQLPANSCFTTNSLLSFECSEIWQRAKVEGRCWICDITKGNYRSLFHDASQFKQKRNTLLIVCSLFPTYHIYIFFSPVGITSSGFRKLLQLHLCISLYIFHSSAMLLSQVLGSSVSVWSSDKWITSVTLALNIFVFMKMSSFYLQKVREEVSEGAVPSTFSSWHYLMWCVFVYLMCIPFSPVSWDHISMQWWVSCGKAVTVLWDSFASSSGILETQICSTLLCWAFSLFFSFKSLEAQELSSGPHRIRWVFLVRSAVWR